MRIKLEMLSKQCKMYEEIIDKMDERIKKLAFDNKKKNALIDELQGELGRLDQLKEKTVRRGGRSDLMVDANLINSIDAYFAV